MSGRERVDLIPILDREVDRPREGDPIPKVTGQDRLLLERITAALKAGEDYRQQFDENDVEGIEQVRALGRQAGRDLGLKISTFASDPSRREDRKVNVIVAVREGSPLYEELRRIRGSKQIRAVFDEIFQSPSTDGETRGPGSTP
jgi:hypothetical protein